VNVDVLVVGAGPVGIYAAYYSGFRGLTCAVMDTLPEAGGQITAMYPEKAIYDVAGFPKIKGRDLIDALVTQAAPYEPKYLLGHTAQTLNTSDEGPVTVTSDRGETITCGAVIITGGIGRFTPRPLPAADGWESKGLVHFVPKLDSHAGKDVVIVGGGDSAFDWAMELHPVANSVTLVHRRAAFRAHESTIESVKKLGVPLLVDSEVTKVVGNGLIESVEITHSPTGEVKLLPAQTLVAALGFVANIGPLADWGLELQKRRIVVDSTTRSNLPRVFAAGDISTYPGKVALISTGFGEAATAVNNAATVINPDAHLFPGHSTGEVG
jgi:thioredoxin reductase